MEEIKSIDIAIIGAGVAGSSAALELCKLGLRDRFILFEREARVASTSRHCNHHGFGILEFKKPLKGLEYASEFEIRLQKKGVNFKPKHSLTKIDGDLLTFSSPNGEVQYRAKKILFAMGAREGTRASLELGGGRSPNIINTGALQRFTYIQKRRPFKKAVIIGSDIVAFSALMTAKKAGIEIVGMVEEQSEIKSFPLLKPVVELFKQIPIFTSAKDLIIHTECKEVKAVEFKSDNKNKNIECDGVIISGNFTPESSLLQQYFQEFNTQNRSLDIRQNFQAQNENIFLAGNVIRGALSAYKCYFEGQKVAREIVKSLDSKQSSKYIQLELNFDVDWVYPSLVDINAPKNRLCNIRFKEPTKGVLKVYLNGRMMLQKEIDAKAYSTVEVGWINVDVKEGDSLVLELE